MGRTDAVSVVDIPVGRIWYASDSPVGPGITTGSGLGAPGEPDELGVPGVPPDRGLLAGPPDRIGRGEVAARGAGAPGTSAAPPDDAARDVPTGRGAERPPRRLAEPPAG
jgi:hypothetical protein